MNLTLTKSIRMQPATCMAFAGAGGKTTAMFQLAREIFSPSILTATSHIGAWQLDMADRHIATDAASLDGLDLKNHGVLLITGSIDGKRANPVNKRMLIELKQFCTDNALPLLIEADGSRQKPLKAWAEHEPPVPKFVNLVVQVVGLSGLGKPLNDMQVHRPEIFSELSGLDLDERVTSNALIKVLIHPNGGLKNVPATTRKIVLLNQADMPEIQAMAREMSTPLLDSYQSVVIASLANGQIHAVYEPIAGIILAAGESSRFGKPKQLLEWKGQPFVKTVAKTALDAGLDPVTVITGANAEMVEQAVENLNVIIARNKEWQSGQGSSIKAGIQSLPPGCGGAIFLLADQPQVNTSILHALKEKHAEGLYPIVAPLVLDRRGNPVLFDKFTFDDLMNIEGDSGGRAIFHKHRVEYLPWHDDSLLLDVDTPEQYQRLISNEDL